MTEAEFNQLRETAWRRSLTPEEEQLGRTWVAAHPEAAEAWAEDLAAARLWRQMPPVPVSSNFTALVLEAIGRETAAATHEKEGWTALARFWRQWIPRLGVAGIMLLALGGAWWWQQREGRSRERELAAVVIQVGRLAGATAAERMPDVSVWRDFETIRRLNEVLPDPDLLTVLK